MADTPYDRPYDTTQRDSQYDRQHDGRFDSRRRLRRPVTLATNVVLTANRNARPTFIPLDQQFGVRKVRIDLQQGRAYVDTIQLVYTDGRRESLAVRQMLSQRDPSITIDLPQANISGIFIDSTQTRQGRGGGGWRRNSATVNVVGLRDGYRR